MKPRGKTQCWVQFRLLGSPKEDWSEDTIRRTCFQWGVPTDLAESTEHHDSSESPIPALNAQRREWRSYALLVPKAHQVTTLNRCHRYAGHQGHDCMLSLFQQCFWWLGMTNQMWQSIKTCMHCLQHEGGLSKAHLCPIVATVPLDHFHVDFTSIETTLELNKSPKVTNILVFQDHFMKHILAYVTPNQTAKTIPKFLSQGYLDLWSPSQAPEWQRC